MESALGPALDRVNPDPRAWRTNSVFFRVGKARSFSAQEHHVMQLLVIGRLRVDLRFLKCRVAFEIRAKAVARAAVGVFILQAADAGSALCVDQMRTSKRRALKRLHDSVLLSGGPL